MSNIFEHGSTWVKVDFHLHTRADKEFEYVQSNIDVKSGYPPQNTFPKDYIEALKVAQIRIGLVTNHNKFDRGEFDCLCKRAKKENILLIPGIELSVKEGKNGVHTLIAFSDEWIADGNDYINQFLPLVFPGKLPENYEKENGKTEKNFIEVVRELDKFGKDYFIIFAHVEQDSGLLKECGGGNLKEWNHANYAPLLKRAVGLQKIHTEESRKNLKTWLPDWHPAEVEGADCKKLDEIGTKAGESWLKVGELSFSAVKYALQDSAERVKKDSPIQKKHSYIKSISFDGGVLNGTKISFSPELNTLIGIRGSGKSSVLEALRYGLGIKMQSTVADREYKTNLIEYMIGSGGKIVVEAIDRFGQEYTVSRILKNAPDVLIDGVLRPGLSICETVVYNPLYFGQKELSSSSETFGNDLVEKLVGNKLSDIRARIQQQKQKVQDIVFSLSKVSNVDEAIDENKKKLADAEFNLQKFSDAGIDEKLKEQTEFDKDEGWLSSVGNLLSNIQRKSSTDLEEWENMIREKLSYSSAHNADLAGTVKTVLTHVLEYLSELRNTYKNIYAQTEAISECCKNFAVKKKSAEEHFAKIKRELDADIRAQGKTPLNLDDFKSLNVRIMQTNELLAALENQRETRGTVQLALKNALYDLNELHREEYKIIGDELSKINDADTGLSIEMKFKGDKAAFLSMMKSTFRGTGIRESAYKDIVDGYVDFAAIYRDADFYKNFSNIRQDFEPVFTSQLFALLTYRVPDKITILYQGKELQQHSLGQRASALILFILSKRESDVIIIDQPEDDLDNQTIYNDVIKLLKKVKPNVQCIFATHNANFPVLGDAEMVHSFDFSGKQMTVSHGTIDTASMQKQIVGIMEGGKEAFAKRKEIYQSWKL